MLDRKEEHLRFAKAQQEKNLVNDFDEIRFIHHSFPEINYEDVDLSTSYAGLTFPYPFYINAMTGGTKRAKEINGNLALSCEQMGIPLALGSVSAALKDPSLLETYTVAKKTAPNLFLWGNLSADSSLEKMKKACDVLASNGLQLHLNLPQELVMPEGDRHFSNWLENIYQAKKTLNLPIMVKETGFGMSQKTIALILQTGIDLIDLGGRGGTNFITIENTRRTKREFTYLEDFGQSTVESLLESKKFQDQGNFLATGGIRQAYDMVKALALGAKGVGVAGNILPVVMEKGSDGALELLKTWKKELKTIYCLLGAKNSEELTQKEMIFSDKLLNYQKQRP